MTGNSDENWYESSTRDYYQNPDVADDYARRQRLKESPADFVIGNLERLQVRAGLRTLDRVGKMSGRGVLDVPAGAGKLTPLLTSRFERYVAGDISAQMLSHITEDVEKRVVDAAKLPFERDAFDVVVNLRLLHRVPAGMITRFLEEALRVASVGVIVSYAGIPRIDRAYKAAKSAIRRPENARVRLASSEFKALIEDLGAIVVRDSSISLGLTSERIATLARA